MSDDYSRIEVRPCDGVLGAEIHGVDLAKPLDRETFEEIHRAWLEYAVIFIRNQRITPGEQTAFAERFGELDSYPFIEPLADHPFIIPIIKEPDTKFNFGGGWHSDMSYTEKPCKATLLYALEIPKSGGDTLFASMTAAYAALSQGMKDLIADLEAVFTAAKVHGATGYYKSADHPMKMTQDSGKEQARYLHPVVRTHPETGNKGIYLDAPHVECFENMTIAESQPLMDYLCGHATSEAFSIRHTWSVGTLTLWDNRCVQHHALNDYPGERREMNRITIKGDLPR